MKNWISRGVNDRDASNRYWICQISIPFLGKLFVSFWNFLFDCQIIYILHKTFSFLLLLLLYQNVPNFNNAAEVESILEGKYRTKQRLIYWVVYPIACVFKSFHLRHYWTKFTIFSKVICQILSLHIFHEKLLNICHANCSRIVSSTAVRSRFPGAPTVLNQMRFVWNFVFGKFFFNTQKSVSAILQKKLPFWIYYKKRFSPHFLLSPWE